MYLMLFIPSNKPTKLFNLAGLKLDISKYSKEVQPPKILPISVTFETSKFDKSIETN